MKKLILASVSLVIIAVAAFKMLPTTPGGGQSYGVTTVTPGESGVPPKSTGTALLWPVGSAASYRLDSTVTISGQNSIRLGAIQTLRILSSNDDTVQAAAVFTNVSLSQSEASGAGQAGKLERIPLLIEFRRDGGIVSVSAPKGAEPAVRFWLAGMMYNSQTVVLPGQATWEAKESDPTANYQCSYSLDGSGTVTKHRKVIPDRSELSLSLTESDITARPGAVWLDSIRLKERGAVGSGKEIAFTVETAFSLTATKTDSSAANLLLALNPDLFSPVTKADAEAGASLTPSPGEMQKLPSVQEGIKKITELAASNHDQAVVVLNRLAERMKLAPAEATELGRVLMEEEFDSFASSDLVCALELTKTPESSAALLSLIEGGASRAVQIQAIAASEGVLDPARLQTALTNILNNGNEDFERQDHVLGAFALLAKRNENASTALREILTPRLQDTGAAPADLNIYLRAGISSGLHNGEMDNAAGVLFKSGTDTGVRATALEYLSQKDIYVAFSGVKDASPAVATRAIDVIADSLPADAAVAQISKLAINGEGIAETTRAYAKERIAALRGDSKK